MKKLFYLITICSIMVTVTTSCGGTKKMSKAMGEHEIEAPFSKWKSNDKYFRAVGSGYSTDMNASKKLALHNAKSEIAGSIQSLFEEVNTRYMNQYAKDALPDLSEKFESMSHDVISQVLTNIVINDTKYFKAKESKEIRCFVAIEMSKEDVGQGVMTGIGNATKDRIDFDAYKYKKIFDEELKKFKGGE